MENIFTYITSGICRKETRVGPYFLDGYSTSPDTSYEYQDCYWHGHTCYQEKCNQNAEKKRMERTKAKEKYSREQGFIVESIWECEYKQMNIQSAKYVPTFTQNHRAGLKED